MKEGKRMRKKGEIRESEGREESLYKREENKKERRNREVRQPEGRDKLV